MLSQLSVGLGALAGWSSGLAAGAGGALGAVGAEALRRRAAGRANRQTANRANGQPAERLNRPAGPENQSSGPVIGSTTWQGIDCGAAGSSALSTSVSAIGS